MTRNWHDLIFSNQPGLRRQRHILFWIVWLIYFTGSFFYEQQGFAAAGSWKWIFIILFKSAFLLLCHMFIVYTVIYFLLPHDPRFLGDFVRAATDADVVIGSRYRTGVNVINWPISRLLLSIGANEYARWITGLPLADSTGGFKCFRREVLEAIDLPTVRSHGYAFQVELTYRTILAGFRVTEVPITFRDRRLGHSKMSWRIAVEAMVLVPQLRRHSR
jgi:hypothetical protein